MRRAFALALWLAAALAAHAAQAPAPVAFVTDIRGTATIEGNGPLAFLAELAPGTRLLLGTGAMAAVTFASSGSEFTLAGPGEFLVTTNEMRAEQGAAPKRRNVAVVTDAGVVGRISRSATASLRMRSIPPPAAKSPLEYPVDTRVATLQPVMLVDGDVREYTVTVTDAAGRDVWRGPAKQHGARVGVRLAPGARYTWSVKSPEGAIGAASFETLPAESIARAEKALAASRKSFSDRVVHAVLLQDLGAGQEARQAWARLSRERPDLPELAARAR